jgi:hypothetical protein
MRVRRFSRLDAGRLWALNNLPNVSETADPTMPLELSIPVEPPASFPYLADVERHFLNAGGEFLVAEQDTHLVGMGGIRPQQCVRG